MPRFIGVKRCKICEAEIPPMYTYCGAECRKEAKLASSRRYYKRNAEQIKDVVYTKRNKKKRRSKAWHGCNPYGCVFYATCAYNLPNKNWYVYCDVDGKYHEFFVREYGEIVERSNGKQLPEAG